LQKISQCWPPTKSRQPFEPLRFKTVPRGKVFERLEEVEYYYIQPTPLISKKNFLEERFFWEIKEGVKYYMSAFLIYFTHVKPS